MAGIRIDSGFADIDNARIYYEIAGEGKPFVMIHAGVADHRQWNNEFAFFANRFQVIRYDLRGYGKSEPVQGEFSHLLDLTSLLNVIKIDQPILIMGCSMGGGLAMDFALAHPEKVRALVMVGSGPSGLELDAPVPAEFEAKFDQAEKAFKAGDLDHAAEIDTQIWFDGVGRNPLQVNQTMRRLALDMVRNVLSHQVKQLGKRLPDSKVSAAERLGELHVPVLLIVGANDIPYMLAAATYMMGKIPTAQMRIIKDAAHLSNMDQPEEFQTILTKFLDDSTR
jgi:pimeloyl-ACP methyl ester carboxylesterase